MSYTNLEVWERAKDVSIEIHKMSMNLPKFEMYEMGSQIRRSSKSVRLNIAEGYGRRKSTKEYVHFLTIAQAFNDETIEILNVLFETGSLIDKNLFNSIHSKLTSLGKKLNNFIKAVKSRN